jgi:hypothetical protein
LQPSRERFASCSENQNIEDNERIYKQIRMNKKGAIIIVEDDKDDQELFVGNLRRCKRPICTVASGQSTQYLGFDNSAEPFIVFSDGHAKN